MKKQLLFTLLLALNTGLFFAQKDKQKVISGIQQYSDIAQELWENPELGYLEEKSAALLQNELEKEGFTIEKGIAGQLR